MNLMEKYERMLFQAGFKLDAKLWIIISAIVAAIAGFLSYSIILLLALPVSAIISVILFIVVLDLLMGWPYLKGLKRIDNLEENLPDALKQMSDTLKAGGTYEYALREITQSEYGHLSKEMEVVLRKLEEGENLENSLKGFSENIESKLIKRSVAVIVDCIKAGAGLADVLEEIADDIRAMHRINQERRSRTLMQVLFIVAAGAVVAPFILGLVSTIIGFLVQATTTGLKLPAEEIAKAKGTADLIMFLMQAYLLIEVAASGAMVSLMREGRISKSIIYIPILLLIAYVIYYVSKFASAVMLGGV